MNKVIIAGSRNFNNYEILKNKVNTIIANILPDVTIISGGARGTDRLGERYAIEHKLIFIQYIPNWDLYGKWAGFVRNESMAKEATHLIAFWDQKSSGTKHMIDIARKRNLNVRVINI